MWIYETFTRIILIFKCKIYEAPVRILVLKRMSLDSVYTILTFKYKLLEVQIRIFVERLMSIKNVYAVLTF